ncbi:Rad52/Rad22 family DNA repair protein [Jeotgalibacillus proteolyticus]|uniref:Rad52/Rad22 family DNA repair protein n=1 Tax=Jeotgalibacillus proteolyticus TaxID=2082395 RepID=UPI003CF7B410
MCENKDCMEGRSSYLNLLKKPFLPEEIEWRVNSASGNDRILVVPYINARTVMKRLDQVCGALWQSKFTPLIVDGKEVFQCSLSIKIEDEWITRTDGVDLSTTNAFKEDNNTVPQKTNVTKQAVSALFLACG